MLLTLPPTDSPAHCDKFDCASPSNQAVKFVKQRSLEEITIEDETLFLEVMLPSKVHLYTSQAEKDQRACCACASLLEKPAV
jgi:hypothetical protein